MASTFDKQPIFNIAELCALHGLRDFIISPGSRSAPLTAALAQHPQINCRVVMDERAAAFIALGLAQQQHQPVGLVCTSGSAGLNYAPAVAEAFYQRIPLVVFTADRPPEWIDQQDGQTIRQIDLYGAHVRAAFTLPVDYSHADAEWHSRRIISEAMASACGPMPGPVQINVPLREPLYPPSGVAISPTPNLKISRVAKSSATLPPETWDSLLALWRQHTKRLILGGLYPPDADLARALQLLSQDNTVTILGDVTANLHQSVMLYHHWDMILATKSEQIRKALQPDLLITFGGQIVSKVVKQYLRQYKPAQHWHVDPGGQMIDTFQALTQVIPLDPTSFFTELQQRICAKVNPDDDYAALWHPLELKAADALETCLAAQPFGEFVAVKQVLQALPEPSHLQLANSMPVRYVNYVGLAGRQIQVNANRGTSGIDGVVSTAVGAALATEQLTTVITGDLAFFYDRNALWHNHLPVNLRIVLLNNQGGGIFKLIEGPGNLSPQILHEFFETPHQLTGKNTAADYGCDYFCCQNAQGLTDILPAFFAAKTRPAILEIMTDRQQNTDIFTAFKKQLA